MKIRLSRSGGFAGLGLERDIDTAALSPRDRRAVEKLLRAGGSGQSVADGFSYEIAAGGETFAVSDENAAPLLERLLREE